MKFELAMGRSVKAGFVEACAEHFIEELNLKNSKWTLIITQEKISKEDACGAHTCVPLPGLVVVTLDSRLVASDVLLLLAHEMVHVKQFATGKFRVEKIKGKAAYYWNGKRISARVHYYDKPWEQQAYGKERNLANSFIKRHKEKLNFA